MFRGTTARGRWGREASLPVAAEWEGKAEQGGGREALTAGVGLFPCLPVRHLPRGEEVRKKRGGWGGEKGGGGGGVR